MRELAIDLRGVVKRYGAITAVDGLDVQVPAGTCVGLLGPNGAGKSTTMRMLTGQTIADEGELDVLGFKMPEESKQARAQLGVTPQLDNLDVTLTVEQNLLVFSYLYRVPRKERKAAIARGLELARLEDRRDTRVDKLSGGMRRRLLIARALVHRPRLVLLDEPTVGLDPQIRQELWALIDLLAQRRHDHPHVDPLHRGGAAARRHRADHVARQGRRLRRAGRPRRRARRQRGARGLRRAVAARRGRAGGAGERTEHTTHRDERRRARHGDGFDGDRRPANLEDVFVLLTGEEIG